MDVNFKNLTSYKDENNNVISTKINYTKENIYVSFRGKNSKIVIDENVEFPSGINIIINGDNSKFILGRGCKVSGSFNLGADCSISFGNYCTCRRGLFMEAAEGTSIAVGRDCLFAINVQVITSDGHPIFDVSSGKRVNTCRPIKIESHVWIGDGALILKGSHIGQGSIIGARSLVHGTFPNNCVIAGNPAKIIKKDVAWERPHLADTAPYYKPDSDSISKSPYWHRTREQ